MILYTSDGCTYEGMSEETIGALRAELGKSTVFVTKETYDEIIAIAVASRKK